MTSTDEPQRLDASAAAKTFIIKADDFGRGPVLDCWRKFVDLCLDAGVVPSMGVVGSDFARNAAAQALARFAAESYGCEFWNHSDAHVDLRTMTSSARIDDTARSHRILAEAIGVAPIAYGAPFNAMDADCARDVATAAPYRLFFDEAAGASQAWELPRDWYATPEVRTQAFRPVRLPKFVSAMERRWAGDDAPPVVIQVHPSYWSDDCFGEFERTLRLLLERGYEPFTVSQFADFLDAAGAPDGKRLTLGAAAFAARDSVGLMRLAGSLRTFPIRDPRSAPSLGLALAEIGRGQGSWALAACAMDNGVRATAFAADPQGSLGAAARDFIAAGALKFSTGAPGERSVDLLIADDPQAPWETTLGTLGAALRASGRAWVRRVSEVSLFADIVEAARRKDREGALAAIEATVRLAGRRLGVVAAASAPHFVNDLEFSTLAAFAGLQPQLRSGASRWSSKRFIGAAVIVEDLLIATETSQRRADGLASGSQAAVEDVAALVRAGAAGVLARIRDNEAVKQLEPNLRVGLFVALGEAAASIEGEDVAALADFARCVCGEEWRQAADLAASQRLPVAQAASEILSWLGGESAPAAGDGLTSRLMQAGVRLRAGEDAFAETLDALAPAKALERLLRELQAGPSPDNVHPFVES